MAASKPRSPMSPPRKTSRPPESEAKGGLPDQDQPTDRDQEWQADVAQLAAGAAAIEALVPAGGGAPPPLPPPGGAWGANPPAGLVAAAMTAEVEALRGALSSAQAVLAEACAAHPSFAAPRAARSGAPLLNPSAVFHSVRDFLAALRSCQAQMFGEEK